MLKLHIILLLVCAQTFLINCYTINHLQRPLWSDLESESNDEFLSKLLHSEALVNEANPSAIASLGPIYDQNDGHPRGLQKRGRQCLWKVCSWALDKRSLRSSLPSANSMDALAKLLY